MNIYNDALAYLSDFVPFRGFHIIVKHDGMHDNAGEVGKDWTEATRKLRKWAEQNGFEYIGDGAFYKA